MGLNSENWYIIMDLRTVLKTFGVAVVILDVVYSQNRKYIFFLLTDKQEFQNKGLDLSLP